MRKLIAYTFWGAWLLTFFTLASMMETKLVAVIPLMLMLGVPYMCTVDRHERD